MTLVDTQSLYLLLLKVMFFFFLMGLSFLGLFGGLVFCFSRLLNQIPRLKTSFFKCFCVA